VLKGEYPGTTFLGDNLTNPVIYAAALYRHSMAVTADGIVYAWGANNYGELGIEPLGNRFEPVRVNKGEYFGTSYLGDYPGNPIVKVTGGISSSYALAGDGTIYSFGRNDWGQLGVANTTDQRYPVHVLRGEYAGQKYLGDDPNNPIVAMVSGGYHTLALTRDGALYAWGCNTNGQLGHGDMQARSTPVRVRSGLQEGGSVYFGMNSRIVAIGAGISHSLALLADGTVWMWGNNEFGNLGDGTTFQRELPVRVTGGAYAEAQYLGQDPENKIVKVAAGSNFTVAVTANGEVFSWGLNEDGQLGDGTMMNSSAPVRVKQGEYDGITYLGDNPAAPITQIVAGERHVVAVVNDDEPFAWGSNGRYQLGRGFDNHETPVRVDGFDFISHPLTTLLSFTGTPVKRRVTLEWLTGQEYDNQYFVVERRFENRPWDSIAQRLGGGTTSGPRDYKLIDDVPVTVGVDTVVYYRLKQVTTNGGKRYFDSIKVIVAMPEFPSNVLSYFRGDTMDAGVRVQWGTASEDNSDSFVIERHFAGGSWVAIGTRPGAGSTVDPSTYELFDDLQGRTKWDTVAYYRLKQVFAGGGIALLDSIVVTPLPSTSVAPSVALTFFRADLIAGPKVNVSWQTATEYHQMRYVIDRRYENNAWDSLTSKSAIGTTQNPSSYTYLDDLAGRKPTDTKVSYRLRAVATDGSEVLLDSATVLLSIAGVTGEGTVSAIRLESPMPNPFVSTAQVSFYVPVHSTVIADLVAGDGRVIQTLIDGDMEAGLHTVSIDGTALPSGNYFFRLQAGGVVRLQPLVHAR
jgi:alpha-tubulin suppressor-like RCC1 family protein